MVVLLVGWTTHLGRPDSVDILVADSSGILAALDEGEPDHGRIVALLKSKPRQLVTTDFVLAEVDYMVLSRLGAESERDFHQQLVDGAFHREPVLDTDLVSALHIAARYSDHAFGITDATLMAICERLGVRDVLTLDHRHFSMFRDRRGRALRLLPAAR